MSDGPPIDPNALAWAEYWYPIAWKGLIVAGVITAIGACATIAFLLLQWRTTNIREAQSEWRTKSLELQTAAAESELAKSNERIAELNHQTERLKSDNLALQKIIQPRRLGALVRFSSPDEPDRPPDAEIQFSSIRNFPGTPVLIQVVPDFESQTLATDMLAVLRAFGWHPDLMGEAISHLAPRNISDGVMVTYTPGSVYANAARSLAESFSKAGLTGPSGWGMPVIVAQGYPVKPDGTPVSDFPGYPKFDRPIDTVIVLIGMKPIPALKTSPN